MKTLLQLWPLCYAYSAWLYLVVLIYKKTHCNKMKFNLTSYEHIRGSEEFRENTDCVMQCVFLSIK